LTAGVPAAMRVSEDPELLYRDAARRCLLEAEEPDSLWGAAVSTWLRDLDNNWRRLERLLIDMLKKRDQWLDLAAQPPSRPALDAALARAIRAEAAHLSAECPKGLIPALVEFAQWAGRNLTTQDPQDPRGLLTKFRGTADDVQGWPLLADLLFTRRGEVRARLDKRTGVPAAAEAARVNANFDSLREALTESPRWTGALLAARRWAPTVFSDAEFARLEALWVTLRLLVAHWRLVSEAKGETDFQEIALAALLALGEPDDPTDLALALDYQIAHLLVDEFQDTSRTQYALLERLTAGWVEGDGRTLFLVGDPLQSIYRFRDADVGLFMHTRDSARFGGIALQHLRLDANFRTCTRVIEWLNRAFSRIFTDCALGAVEFHPIAPTQSDRVGAEVSVQFADVSMRHQVVIATLNGIRARDPTATIALLVRSRAHLTELLPAMLSAGLPIAAAEIESLQQIPIVNDLVALTRALYTFTDRTAWLAVLRAPWCGLSLADLEALVAGNPDRLVWEMITDPGCAARVSSAEFARLRAVIAQLEVALAARGRLDYATLVELTWRSLNGPACVDEIAHRHASLYFEALARLQAEGRELTASVLAHAVADPVAPLSAGEAKIQIMTIHHAKGLEFDSVLLPELHRPVRGESRALLLGQATTQTDRILAPLPAVGNDSAPLYEYLREREQRTLRAEASRLLYVAMTRARVALHLFAIAPNESSPPLGTFLRLLWPALEAPVSASLATAPARVKSPAPPMLRRLVADALPRAPTPWRQVETPPALEFAWASSLAKQIGTVTHAMLQTMASGAPPALPATAISTIRQRLRALGLTTPDLDRAVQEVSDSLAKTEASPRGRWLLSDQHQDARSEYRLTLAVGDEAADFVIDRTFIDNGVRWIVDYKTGTHLGGDRDAFIDSEVVRYRAQLETYAGIFRALETRPIRVALYFPRFDGWREWTPAGPRGTHSP
ncbi:MAG: UvrD-helicase domain-containing protein, partial [Gammaproteobacteria bacterium]